MSHIHRRNSEPRHQVHRKTGTDTPLGKTWIATRFKSAAAAVKGFFHGPSEIKTAREYVRTCLGAQRFADLEEAVISGDRFWTQPPLYIDYAATDRGQFVAGSATIAPSPGAALPLRNVVEDAKHARQAIPAGHDIRRALHVVAQLTAEPQPVRSFAGCTDSSDPWIVTLCGGRERQFDLDLLDESDPAFAFRRQFSLSVSLVCGSALPLTFNSAHLAPGGTATADLLEYAVGVARIAGQLGKSRWAFHAQGGRWEFHVVEEPGRG